MYELIVQLISTLILTSSPMFIKYTINNMVNIVKFYILTINIINLCNEA